MPRAFELYQRFDVEQGVKDIASTLAALRALPEQQGGAGVLGLSLIHI